MKEMNLLVIIYADFESILVPQNNGKQNPDESYRSKYQKHIVCSYGYKFVCVNDKFRHTEVKMLFTILLIIWSKKVNIAVMWWKNILTKNL